jgi:hypothetical protein
VNRRKLSRYQISGPTTFTWTDGEIQRQGNGWTRDLNYEGAYICSACCPPAGIRTNLEVFLPPFGKMGRILKLQMDAHVLRVETKPPALESIGFAVRCERVVMRVASEDMSEEIIENREFDWPES